MKDDSIEGIYDSLKECAVISKSPGGIGVSVQLEVTYVEQMVHPMALILCCVSSMILPVMLTKEVARERVCLLFIWSHGMLIFLNFLDLRKNHGKVVSSKKEIYFDLEFEWDTFQILLIWVLNLVLVDEKL